MAAIKIPEDIQAMKFEETMDELEAMMRKLDAGGMTLEDATDCYIRCCLLRRHCSEILENLRQKVLLYTDDKEKWEEFSPLGSRGAETMPESDDDPDEEEKETGSEDMLL